MRGSVPLLRAPPPPPGGFSDCRLRYGKSSAAGVARRRERGPGQARVSPPEEGVGRELRQAEDDTAVVIAESDRALALPAIRLPQYAAVLLPAHRFVQKGTRRPGRKRWCEMYLS